VSRGKANEDGKGALAANDGNRNQHYRGGIDYEGEEHRENEDGREIREEDVGEGHWQGNQIGVIAAVQKDGIPAPERGSARDGHGQNDEEVFVRDRSREWIENAVAA
jgi:hypothetical protein